MEIDLVGLVIGAVSMIGGGGVAIGAQRTKIRRLEADITEVRNAAARHADEDVKSHTAMIDRLARIETKLDGLIERME